MHEKHPASGGGPAAILSDLNANPGDTRFLQDILIGAGKWIDIGARASLWGGAASPPPRRTTGSKYGARRDYIFVHPALVRFISEVRVHQDATFRHPPGWSPSSNSTANNS